MRRPSSHLCHGATGQRNSACVQKRSPKKLQKVTFSKPSFRTFFTAVMVALCTTFSADSRVPQKAQKKFRNPQISELFWSECRDSNSRPLEPHSSAIPNFATPGFLIASLDCLSILAHLLEKCNHYFSFFYYFFAAASERPHCAGFQRYSPVPDRHSFSGFSFDRASADRVIRLLDTEITCTLITTSAPGFRGRW